MTMIRNILAKMRKHYNKNFVLIILALIIIGGFFLPLFLPSSKLFVTPDFGQSDLFQLIYPYKFALAQSLKANTLPLWNSMIGTGFPQLAEGQTGTFNIINIILFKFLPFVTAINLGYALLFLIICISTYLYLRVLKRSRSASFFSAIIFDFSGFFIVHISHFNLIQTASFLPLVFLTVQLFIDYPKKKLLFFLIFSLVLSQQLFSGFPQVTFITLCAVTGYVLVLYSKKKLSLKAVILLGSALFLVLGLTAIQVLPSFEFLQHSNRKGGFGLQEVTYYSYPLKHLLTFISPFALGDPRNGTYPPYTQNNGSIFWENTGYIGLLPLIFAAFAVFVFRKKNIVQAYTVVLIGAFLLMLGKHSPFYFLYSILPLNFFRVPSRFILIFVWALCILAAFGFDAIISILKKSKLNFYGILLVAISFCVISFYQVFSFAISYNPTGDSVEWLKQPKSIEKMKSSGLVRYYTIGSAVKWNEYFVNQGWENSNVYKDFNENLVPNSNVLYGVPSYQVYQILITRRYQHMSLLLDRYLLSTDSSHLSLQGENLLRMNAISHLISTNPIADKLLIYEEKQSRNHYSIYKIEDVAFARLYHKFKVIHTVAELDNNILSKTFENDVALIEDQIPQLEDTGEASQVFNNVTVKSGSISAVVESKTGGLFVVAETFFPGWKAFVDNQKTKIYPVNLNQMGLVLPKGSHEVRFVYEPSVFKKGAIISLISHAIIVLLVAFLVFSSLHHRISAKTKHR